LEMASLNEVIQCDFRRTEGGGGCKPRFLNQSQF